MRNIRIYQSTDLVCGASIELDKAAANHLIRVLRLKDQQEFTLFNGTGGEFTARLEIDGKRAIAHIQNFNEINNESPLHIHLLQGISKGDHMDLTIQKAVELGVSQITPIKCERTVVNLKADRLQKKLQHWRAIAISACEQSGRNILPPILPVCGFSQASAELRAGSKFILDPLATHSLPDCKPQQSSVTFFIGPEGGLSEAEITQARAAGFSGVRLGPRILRTETAALTAVSSAQLLWGDLN